MESSLSCVVCKGDSACDGMDNMCADCYWDTDYDRKLLQRQDPVWRYNRLVSFAVTCMGLTKRSAVAFALKEMKLTKPPTKAVKSN